jgi:hypothetical protein
MEDFEHINMQIPREENKWHATTHILKYPASGRYFIISYETVVQVYLHVIVKYTSTGLVFISLLFVQSEMVGKISKL